MSSQTSNIGLYKTDLTDDIKTVTIPNTNTNWDTIDNKLGIWSGLGIYLDSYQRIVPENDDTGIFTRAWNDSITKKKPLVLPPRQLLIGGTFNFTNAPTWFGSGDLLTDIHYTGSNSVYMMTFTCVGGTINNVGFSASNGQPLLDINGAFNMFFGMCKFSGGNPAVRFTNNSGDNYFTLCQFADNFKAIQVESQMNYLVVCNFAGNDIGIGSLTGVGYDGIHLTGCTFVGGMYTLNPSAWTASTTFNFGDLVSASGNIYQVTTAGTSGTTAPSGTGSSITDGSVTWAYREAVGAGIKKAKYHIRKQTQYGEWRINHCWFEGCQVAVSFEGGYSCSVTGGRVNASQIAIKASSGVLPCFSNVVTGGEQNYTPAEYSLGAEGTDIQSPFSLVNYSPSIINKAGTESIKGHRVGYSFPDDMDVTGHRLMNFTALNMLIEHGFTPSTNNVKGRVYIDDGINMINFHDGSSYRTLAQIRSGATGSRPTGVPVGFEYYDTTLGKPVWYNGSSVWHDATGSTV